MWGLPECLGNGSLWDKVTRPVLVGLSNMHSRLSKIVTYRYLEEKTYNKNRSFDIAFIKTIKEEPVINGVKHAKEKR